MYCTLWGKVNESLLFWKVSSSVGQIEKVFQAARKQKNWDHFSKGQRKNLDSWLKQAEVRPVFNDLGKGEVGSVSISRLQGRTILYMYFLFHLPRSKLCYISSDWFVFIVFLFNFISHSVSIWKIIR